MRVYFVVAALAVTIALDACHPAPAAGPAEKAGAKIDKAAQDTKDTAKDTKDDVKHDLNK